MERLRKDLTTICRLCLMTTFIMTAASCTTSKLLPGDLLFHVSPHPNAITSVTSGMVDHVAVVISSDTVIEAVGQGVVLTPISELLHQEGQYQHARLRKKFDWERTLNNLKTYLGKPYDKLYLPDNDSIYCTELVQISFVNKKGQRIFAPIPMSFHDESGHITAYWRNFYQQYHMEVPEGQPGTNPNEMILRPELRSLGILKKVQ